MGSDRVHTDVRRMNVALTRAKSSVFILGNVATLERSDQNWKTIVQDARDRSFLVDVSPRLCCYTVIYSGSLLFLGRCFLLYELRW